MGRIQRPIHREASPTTVEKRLSQRKVGTTEEIHHKWRLVFRSFGYIPKRRRSQVISWSSSRMQSLQQLLWTAAPSLGPGRFRGTWVMANLAPARCGVTATPRAFQTCPRADQLRVSKDNLACSFVLTELQALADRGGAAFGRTRCVVSIGS